MVHGSMQCSLTQALLWAQSGSAVHSGRGATREIRHAVLRGITMFLDLGGHLLGKNFSMSATRTGKNIELLSFKQCTEHKFY